jgi:ABC-type polysaccharide/polyol phosphate transport system ATPase subunit
VLVTHDMGWVTEFCNRAMLLDHGHVILEGDPAEVVKLHEERSERARVEREAELAAKLAAVEGARAGAAG